MEENCIGSRSPQRIVVLEKKNYQNTLVSYCFIKQTRFEWINFVVRPTSYFPPHVYKSTVFQKNVPTKKKHTLVSSFRFRFLIIISIHEIHKN
jgi:hypothetical protein